MASYKCQGWCLEYSESRIRKEICKGADINTPIQEGVTYLMLAESESLVRDLLARGADPKAIDEECRTALWMREFQQKEVGALRAILEAGCDVNATDIRGETAIEHCIDPQAVKLFIEYGADVNHADNEGNTPLHFAVEPETIEILVEAGANVNAATTFEFGEDELEVGEWPCGTTPLMLARDYECAKYLIDHGADINAITRGGYSVLMYLLVEFETGPVVAVMNAGPKMNVTAQDGNTPLHLIYSSFKSCLAEYAEPCRSRELMVDVVKKVLESGCDPNAVNQDGQTPLHCIGSGYAMEEVIRAGGDIERRDNKGNTPIIMAAFRNYKCINVLLGAGADVNAVNNEGQNALFFINEIRTANLLIKAGINVNCQDKYGNTPLHIMVERRRDDLVRYLLKNHADPGITNHLGKKAIEDNELHKYEKQRHKLCIRKK